MWETYSGFRSLGFNMILSSLAVPVIHPCFSLVTCPNFFDPFLRIYTHNIHKAKHGSDTGVYDTEGDRRSIIDLQSSTFLINRSFFASKV